VIVERRTGRRRDDRDSQARALSMPSNATSLHGLTTRTRTSTRLATIASIRCLSARNTPAGSDRHAAAKEARRSTPAGEWILGRGWTRKAAGKTVSDRTSRPRCAIGSSDVVATCRWSRRKCGQYPRRYARPAFTGEHERPGRRTHREPDASGNRQRLLVDAAMDLIDKKCAAFVRSCANGASSRRHSESPRTTTHAGFTTPAPTVTKD